MKTSNLSLVIIFIISSFLTSTNTFSRYNFPATECVWRLDGYLDKSSLSKRFTGISCREGQKLYNYTSSYSNKSCCDWIDVPPKQITNNEQLFVANTCVFNESNVIRRKSLLVMGDDLICFPGEELRNFSMKIDGFDVIGACCFQFPTTTATITLTTQAITIVESVKTSQNDSNSTIITSDDENINKQPENDSQTLIVDEKLQISSPDDAQPQNQPTVNPETKFILSNNQETSTDSQKTANSPSHDTKTDDFPLTDDSSIKSSNNSLENDTNLPNDGFLPDLISDDIKSQLSASDNAKIHEIITKLTDVTFNNDDDDGDDQINTISVNPHAKLRAGTATSQLPSKTAASECIYASSTATDPIKGYMNYEDPDTTFACRSQQKMIEMMTTNPDDKETYTVYCCKYDYTLPPLNPVPLILAHECEFLNDDGVTLLSFSGVTPGDDLVCDDESMMVTKSVKHVVTNAMVEISCCKPKDNETTVAPTTAKITTTSQTTTLSTTISTTTRPATTILPTTFLQSTTRSSLPSSNAKPAGIAGSECCYFSDGDFKVGYMDFYDDNPICRSQQKLKFTEDRQGYKRSCCQFDSTLPKASSVTYLEAPQCVPDGNTFKRWSIIKAGSDLVCKPGYKILNTFIIDKDVDTMMACCTKDIIETTTTPRPDQTTTTTIATTTTVSASAQPKAGIQCNYDAEKSLITSYMEDCNLNTVCRSKEVPVSAYVTNSQKMQIKKCCCDFQANLPPNKTAAVASIIAPKCVYNNDGYINAWSVVESGDDLGCTVQDNLMTFTAGSGLVANEAMSCCLKKGATTIPTTMRTSPMTTQSTTPMPKTIPKMAALECVYLSNGSLNIAFMDWVGSSVACRSNFRMKIIEVDTSYGVRDKKCCCELDPTLPFDDSNVGSMLATTCYFSKKGDLVNWSIMRSARDLTCKEDYYMYNVTRTINGSSVGFSCCQPIDKPIPTTTTPAPLSVSTTTVAPDQKIYFAGPICEYKADKSLHIGYMERCQSDLVCRSQEVMINTTLTRKDGTTSPRCCCDPRPDLPPTKMPYPVRAQTCYYNVYGYVAIWSVLPFGPDLSCASDSFLETFKLEIDAQIKNMSCCQPKDQTTLATTERPRSTTPMTTAATTTMTTNTTSGHIIVNATSLTTSKISLNIANSSVTSTFVSTIAPVTWTIISNISIIATEATTVNASNQVTTVAPVMSPTNPIIPRGKRTVAPKSLLSGTHPLWPKRNIKPGECPDCIFPNTPIVDGTQMRIMHLNRTGPILGKCPRSYTMRLILPIKELGLKNGKCCCDYDAVPVPYKIW